MNLLRPHSATITVETSSRVSGKTVFSDPETITISNCRIEPVAGTRYIQDSTGNKINYKFRFFCDLFDEAGTDMEGQKLNYGTQSFTIVQCFPYKKHVEMKLI